MGWFSRAWDNVSSAASATVGAVADSVTYVAAEATNAVTSGINAVGGEGTVENWDWVEESKTNGRENIAAAADATMEVAGEALEVVEEGAEWVGGTVLGEQGAEALGWDGAAEKGRVVDDALISAGDWVVDTAAPAVGEGLAWTAAAIPATGYAFRGIEAATGWDGLGIAEKNRQVESAVAGFGQYAWENPGRATELVAQGFVNGVTSTVGFVGDGARMIVTGAGDIVKNVGYNYTTRHLINGVYALGAEEGEGPLLERQSFFSLTSAANEASGGAFGWSTGLNDVTQFVERIKPEFLADTREFIEDENGDMIENPDYMQEIELAEGEEVPEWAEIVENENANYERVLLYGGQAVFEVPAFIATAALTGGTGTAAYVARFGGKGIQTAATLRRVDMVADGIHLAQRGASLADKGADASKVTRAVGMADDFANGTRRFTMAQRASRRISMALGRNVDDASQVIRQSDLLEYLGKYSDKLRNAQTKLDDLVESGTATQRQLTNAQRKVTNAENALERARGNVNELAKSSGNALEEVSEEAARNATRTLEQMSTTERLSEGFRIGSMRGARFTDPFRSPVIDAAGVSASFGFGYYIDQKNAAQELASGQAISVNGAEGIINESREDMNELREDSDFLEQLRRERELRESGGGSPGGEEIRLRDDFQGGAPTGGDDTVPLPGGDVDRDTQTNSFNNRANGIVIPTGDGGINVQVSEEAANELKDALRQK